MYEKTLETRILRIKHKITFAVGTRAVDLKDMLKHVPDEAKIDEVLDDASTGTMASIEFHEEKRET